MLMGYQHILLALSSLLFQNKSWGVYGGSQPFSSLVLLGDPLYAPSLHNWAVLIAGVFVLIAFSLSFYLIFTHLANYTCPEEQKWLIGVVFMVPVYSVESFASLWMPTISIECDILRNCYEAFALYSFGNYLIACLGGEEKILSYLEQKALSCLSDEQSKGATKASLQHPFLLKLLIPPWPLGHECFRNIKFGIVQYMITKTICALLALLLELFGVYGDGEFKWNYGYPYITLVLNFSQMWALYCLVQFYNVTHEELEPIKPLAKFLCFKAIVFATWWQGVIIALLCSFGAFPGTLSAGAKFQTSLQDFIICIEMAIAAIVHTRIFPATPYQCLHHLKHAKLFVNSDAPSKQPLLEIDEVEEYDEHSYKRTVDADAKIYGTSIKESIQDVVLGGGETVVEDVKITVSQAVEPVEKGISLLNEHLPWKAKTDEEDVKVTTINSERTERVEIQACYTTDSNSKSENS